MLNYINVTVSKKQYKRFSVLFIFLKTTHVDVLLETFNSGNDFSSSTSKGNIVKLESDLYPK